MDSNGKNSNQRKRVPSRHSKGSVDTKDNAAALSDSGCTEVAVLAISPPPPTATVPMSECRRSSRKKIIKFDVRDLLNKNRKPHKIQIEARIDSNVPSTSASKSSALAVGDNTSGSSGTVAVSGDLSSKQKTFMEKSAIFRRFSISQEQTKPPPPPLPPMPPSILGKAENKSSASGVGLAGKRINRTQEYYSNVMLKPKQTTSLIVAQVESTVRSVEAKNKATAVSDSKAFDNQEIQIVSLQQKRRGRPPKSAKADSKEDIQASGGSEPAKKISPEKATNWKEYKACIIAQQSDDKQDVAVPSKDVDNSTEKVKGTNTIETESARSTNDHNEDLEKTEQAQKKVQTIKKLPVVAITKLVEVKQELEPNEKLLKTTDQLGKSSLIIQKPLTTDANNPKTNEDKDNLSELELSTTEIEYVDKMSFTYSDSSIVEKTENLEKDLDNSIVLSCAASSSETPITEQEIKLPAAKRSKRLQQKSKSGEMLEIESKGNLEFLAKTPDDIAVCLSPLLDNTSKQSDERHSTFENTEENITIFEYDDESTEPTSPQKVFDETLSALNVQIDNQTCVSESSNSNLSAVFETKISHTESDKAQDSQKSETIKVQEKQQRKSLRNRKETRKSESNKKREQEQLLDKITSQTEPVVKPLPQDQEDQQTLPETTNILNENVAEQIKTNEEIIDITKPVDVIISEEIANTEITNSPSFCAEAAALQTQINEENKEKAKPEDTNLDVIISEEISLVSSSFSAETEEIHIVTNKQMLENLQEESTKSVRKPKSVTQKSSTSAKRKSLRNLKESSPVKDINTDHVADETKVDEKLEAKSLTTEEQPTHVEIVTSLSGKNETDISKMSQETSNETKKTKSTSIKDQPTHVEIVTSLSGKNETDIYKISQEISNETKTKKAMTTKEKLEAEILTTKDQPTHVEILTSLTDEKKTATLKMSQETSNETKKEKPMPTKEKLEAEILTTKDQPTHVEILTSLTDEKETATLKMSQENLKQKPVTNKEQPTQVEIITSGKKETNTSQETSNESRKKKTMSTKEQPTHVQIVASLSEQNETNTSKISQETSNETETTHLEIVTSLIEKNETDTSTQSQETSNETKKKKPRKSRFKNLHGPDSEPEIEIPKTNVAELKNLNIEHVAETKDKEVIDNKLKFDDTKQSQVNESLQISSTVLLEESMPKKAEHEETLDADLPKTISYQKETDNTIGVTTMKHSTLQDVYETLDFSSAAPSQAPNAYAIKNVSIETNTLLDILRTVQSNKKAAQVEAQKSGEIQNTFEKSIEIESHKSPIESQKEIRIPKTSSIVMLDDDILPSTSQKSLVKDLKFKKSIENSKATCRSETASPLTLKKLRHSPCDLDHKKTPTTFDSAEEVLGNEILPSSIQATAPTSTNNDEIKSLPNTSQENIKDIKLHDSNEIKPTCFDTTSTLTTLQKSRKSPCALVQKKEPKTAAAKKEIIDSSTTNKDIVESFEVLSNAAKVVKMKKLIDTSNSNSPCRSETNSPSILKKVSSSPSRSDTSSPLTLRKVSISPSRSDTSSPLSLSKKLTRRYERRSRRGEDDSMHKTLEETFAEIAALSSKAVLEMSVQDTENIDDNTELDSKKLDELKLNNPTISEGEELKTDVVPATTLTEDVNEVKTSTETDATVTNKKSRKQKKRLEITDIKHDDTISGYKHDLLSPTDDKEELNKTDITEEVKQSKDMESEKQLKLIKKPRQSKSRSAKIESPVTEIVSESQASRIQQTLPEPQCLVTLDKSTSSCRKTTESMELAMATSIIKNDSKKNVCDDSKLNEDSSQNIVILHSTTKDSKDSKSPKNIKKSSTLASENLKETSTELNSAKSGETEGNSGCNLNVLPETLQNQPIQDQVVTNVSHITSETKQEETSLSPKRSGKKKESKDVLEIHENHAIQEKVVTDLDVKPASKEEEMSLTTDRLDIKSTNKVEETTSTSKRSKKKECKIEAPAGFNENQALEKNIATVQIEVTPASKEEEISLTPKRSNKKKESKIEVLPEKLENETIQVAANKEDEISPTPKRSSNKKKDSTLSKSEIKGSNKKSSKKSKNESIEKLALADDNVIKTTTPPPKRGRKPKTTPSQDPTTSSSSSANTSGKKKANKIQSVEQKEVELKTPESISDLESNTKLDVLPIEPLDEKTAKKKRQRKLKEAFEAALNDNPLESMCSELLTPSSSPTLGLSYLNKSPTTATQTFAESEETKINAAINESTSINELDEDPDPLKDIEKFIADGVNLLKKDYKIDEDSVDNVMTSDKKVAEIDAQQIQQTIDEVKTPNKDEFPLFETPADTPVHTPISVTPSITPPPKSPESVGTLYEEQTSGGGVRRSHRIKLITKNPKALVGRGLVRDKERFSIKDDVETKGHYTIGDHLLDLAEVEAKNAKFLKDMEERLSNFQVIKDNEYKCERVISREARKMICDCFLTSEEEVRGELGCGEDCLNRLLMIECGPECNVKERCTNKRFQKLLCSPCRVFRTEKKGFGILADIEILPGEFIMEYVGEVIDGDEFERRRVAYSQEKNRHYYFMALRSDAIIDATIKGNISRFINHSCDPNAETQKWTVNGELRIGFFSRKSIMPGEEITFNYQYQRYGRDAQRCFCESSNCTGWIGQEPTSDEGEQIDDDEDDSEDEDDTPNLLAEDDEDSDASVSDPEEVQKKLEMAAAQSELLVTLDDKIKPETPNEEKSEQKDAEETVKAETDEDSKSKFKKLLSKMAEKVAAKQKQSKREQKLQRKKKTKESASDLASKQRSLEDPDIVDEVEFLSRCGLKNQLDTLRLSRLMVRAKIVQTRLNLLEILRKGELPCRRLFLDYHGLRLVHGWMSEDAGNMQIRSALLQTLELLPIPNKTMLNDCKVMQAVRNWCGSNVALSPNEDSLSSNSNSQDAAALPANSSTSENQNEQENTEGIELQKLALKLITTWDGLPEIFKIPKKERIEQMKEHEREADRQFAETEGDRYDRYSSDRYGSNRFGRRSNTTTTSTSRFVKPHGSKPLSQQQQANGNTAMRPSNETSDNLKYLSKTQRREMFAAKVARDEAEKRMAEERREFETKCRFFGLDPKKTRPQDIPFGVNPSTGQWYSVERKPINTPPSYAHVQVPVKPKSTNPDDYQLPAVCISLPPQWKYAITPLGQIYYYHIQNRVPQWEPPTPAQLQLSEVNADDDDDVDSGNEHTPATGADSSDDNEEVLIGMDAAQLKAYIDRKVEMRRQKRYQRLVDERAISPRREEDRVYNQIEVRKYKENKEKIRKRKEEIRRKRAEALRLSSLNMCTLGSLSDSIANLVKSETEEDIGGALPIQDYLLSSDEECDIKIDVNSPLIDKIVEGDKIVDELDALTTKRPLKRPLPPHRDFNEPSTSSSSTSAAAAASSAATSMNTSVASSERQEYKKRKLEKKEKRKPKEQDAKYRKNKEKFRCEIAGIIVHHLKPYRKDSCTVGRIQSNEDFNHLARKLTHFVMIKELKYCESVGQILVVTESVKNKSREFIKKYMAKYGDLYVKPTNDPEFKDIPFSL